MRNKKYIIFDLDGTLVDSFPTVVNACKLVFEKHAPAMMPDDAFFDRYHYGDMEQMFKSLAEIANLQAEQFRKEYDKEYAIDFLTGTRIIERQHEILKEARRQGLNIIIITNKRQEIAESVCQKLFNSGEIDHIIGRQDTTPIKPRHIIIERLRSLGIDIATQCLEYYGDSDTDRKTSELLNTTFINTKK